ncbi:MAG: MFS transporter [Verrucomicrobia bacterium]|nr:MFS transporter [Verrucomicrobiota bacterium]MBU4248464.1 MFS transporter [Verrucomicrobiota bacterium]MBU4292106.1 MFS transporter [Verrucomicrobiota bacterium]MBU4497485.1 MFS transporter [Verrucomicrobiota bacterium]MCG2681081.1 MFS transporter [Kiritimatiellia bacterium]
MTTFNNFLSDTFHMTADTRGFLEFPRELPGFLCALFAGLLFFLPESVIAAGCAFAVGLGMLGLAFWGGHWSSMLIFMLLWGIGAHLLMPIRSSISMALAHEGQVGRRLGQIQGTTIAASIGGCGLVWIGMKYLHADYRIIFSLGGAAALVAGIVLLGMRMPGAHLQRPKFVWNRHYWLYYTLALLFGARKQIFITFGPWVLVKIFNQPAYIFAQLWIAAAVLGVVFQPALGRAIDRFGERKVLMADAVCVFLVCAGYGAAHLIDHRLFALGLLYACFVGDQLLFGVNMARDTYLAKIAVKPEDISPTLSLGISINHLVSMSIPTVGGLMWMKYGHPSVFIGAAGIATLMYFFSRHVRTPSPPSQPC